MKKGTYKVEFYIDVNDIDDKNGSCIQLMTHHMDYFIDLDSWPEIDTIYNVKLERIEENQNEGDNE